jgi:Uma2 family endonuclease
MAGELKLKLDYDDYARIPPDRNRHELLDGVLHVTPAPSPQHQRASKRLQRMLEAYFEDRGLGEVFDAPIDVILSPHDVVQPDLVVVTQPAQVSGRGIEGAPELVVEILSASTREHDRTVKAQRYATLGIRHYWLVDPDERHLQCFRTTAGRLALVTEGQGDRVLAHPDWPGLSLDLARLWR